MTFSSEEKGALVRKQVYVFHEIIYKWIRENKEAGDVLSLYCRHKLKYRKRPMKSAKNISDRKSILERPGEVDENRFGDFETGTIIEKKKGLVHRKLSFTNILCNIVLYCLIPVAQYY